MSQSEFYASRLALQEALNLSNSIIQNIELSEIPLENIALKTIRLARLLGDSEMQKALAYEVKGYPDGGDGLPSDIYMLAELAGREFSVKTNDTASANPKVYINSISSLEAYISTNRLALSSSTDPNVSIVSANPNQIVMAPKGNQQERNNLATGILTAQKRLSERRMFIYDYALKKHYELKFSGIADDIFTRYRTTVDSLIAKVMPESIKRLTAIYDNLQSDNAADWENAVHGCRKVLQDLADIIFPPTDITRYKAKQIIRLGQEHYINRIIAFIEDASSSKTYDGVVRSHISFIGDRLDAIYNASNKGTHATVTKAEADRYVIFTYLLLGDILSLKEDT